MSLFTCFMSLFSCSLSTLFILTRVMDGYGSQYNNNLSHRSHCYDFRPDSPRLKNVVESRQVVDTYVTTDGIAVDLRDGWSSTAGSGRKWTGSPTILMAQFSYIFQTVEPSLCNLANSYVDNRSYSVYTLLHGAVLRWGRGAQPPPPKCWPAPPPKYFGSNSKNTHS